MVCGVWGVSASAIIFANIDRNTVTQQTMLAGLGISTHPRTPRQA